MIRRLWRSAWESFADSFDPEQCIAFAAPRQALFISVSMIAVFLAMGYLPGLAEATALSQPWPSILFVATGTGLTLLSYRHGCKGTWGRLGCLLDKCFYLAALGWAATSSTQTTGFVISGIVAVMLLYFHGKLYGLTTLMTLAVVGPVVAVIASSPPDPLVAIALVVACTLGLTRMEITRAQRQRGFQSHAALVSGVSGVRYRIGAVVGAGGMGVVYRGVDEQGRDVAIKRLHPHWLDTPVQHTRLVREALIVNEIDHSGVVPIVDHGEVAGAGPFLVMQLLVGTTLRTAVDRPGGRLHWDQVLGITEKLLKALAAAHDKQVVHCDVKPSNIFLCEDGSVKLLDFGIAKPPAAMLDTTLSVRVVGTPACMAPEQSPSLKPLMRVPTCGPSERRCSGRSPATGPAHCPNRFAHYKRRRAYQLAPSGRSSGKFPRTVLASSTGPLHSAYATGGQTRAKCRVRSNEPSTPPRASIRAWEVK